MQTIDVKNFGPNAYYEICPSKKPQTQPVKSHKWNAVVKGVDTEITENMSQNVPSVTMELPLTIFL